MRKHRKKQQNIQEMETPDPKQQGIQKIGTHDQGSWITILSFLKMKEIARLSRTSTNIHLSVNHTPCAYLSLPDRPKKTLTFQDVSTLNNHAKELRSLIKANSLGTRYKIADSTPSLSGIYDFCNRLRNYYTSNVDLHEKFKETYLHAVVPAIGAYAGMQIGSVCNSMIHALMGGNVAVDLLIGGAVYCASTGILSFAAGGLIGKCAGYPQKQYGQYVGQITGAAGALLSSQVSGFYYGIDKIVNDSSTSATVVAGAMALAALGLYKNKSSIDLNAPCIELKAIKSDLNNLKRLQ